MSSQEIVRVWTNAKFPESLEERLRSIIAPNILLKAERVSSLNLDELPPDPQLETASIAFGQPDVAQLLSMSHLRWVHLTSAGYTNYDRRDLRDHLTRIGCQLTTSSGVYDSPCAQHAFAMLLSFARQLPAALHEQMNSRGWSAADLRRRSQLLRGQTIVLLGFGEIAKQLVKLLEPWQVNLIGYRRRVRGDEPIPVVDGEGLNAVLAKADHVINMLPANEDSLGFFDAARLSSIRQGAYFYNIGRGSTVDQIALEDCLRSGALSGAYLDVTTPEPLPSDHSLWNAPNCFITPHTAGGFREEMQALVEHFLSNFDRFQSSQPLQNRVI